MPWAHRVIVPVLGLSMLIPFTGGVLAETPEAGMDVPRPEECQVAPRSLESIKTLIAAMPTAVPPLDLGTLEAGEIAEVSVPREGPSVSVDGTPIMIAGTVIVTMPPQPTPDLRTPTPVTLPDGSAVDVATEAAIRATLRELIACNNAGDSLRFVSLYSDRHLVELFGLLSWEDPSASEFAEPPSPLPPDEWEPMLIIEDLRLLPDGRVAALVSKPWRTMTRSPKLSSSSRARSAGCSMVSHSRSTNSRPARCTAAASAPLARRALAAGRRDR